MNEQAVSVKILDRYPAVDTAGIDEMLQEEIKNSGIKILVLDDDPTGVQTVHDISVYTDWSEESIRQGLMEDSRLFYILTNSRGFTMEQTRKVHRTIAENVVKAAGELGIRTVIMSRSDSCGAITRRNHRF